MLPTPRGVPRKLCRPDGRYNLLRHENYTTNLLHLHRCYFYTLFLQTGGKRCLYKQKITTRKNGKETKKYYATVFNSATRKAIYGPYREKRSQALEDEAKIRQRMEEQKRSGAPDEPKNKTLTVSELYEVWLPYAKKTLADATYNVYTDYYLRYIAPVFGGSSDHVPNPGQVLPVCRSVG